MSCIECNYKFNPGSSKYYCCDRNAHVCLLCLRKPCKKCFKPRNNQVVSPKCDKCYRRKMQGQLLFQYGCAKFYCSECLSPIFRNAYSKVTQSIQLINNENIMVKLYCGDEYPYNLLFAYFMNFCVECGRNYLAQIDYQLTDGAKLCSSCTRNFGHLYEQKLFKCLCCDTICKDSSKTTYIQGDAIVCLDCFKQSNIQQNVINASRVVDNKYYPENNSVNKQHIQKKGNDNKIAQQMKIVKDSDVKADSKLTKLFKKESIQELKQKKKAQRSLNFSQKSQNGKTILSKFSSQFEQVEGDETEQIIKLKKHLSNQTVVQNFKIQISKHQLEQQTLCEQCGIIIDKKFLFKNSSSKDKSEISTFASFQDKNNQRQLKKQNICRVCYVNSINKSFLGFSNQLQDVIRRERHVSAPKFKPSTQYQSPQKNKQSMNSINSQIIPNKQSFFNNPSNKYLKLSSNEDKIFGKTSMIAATDTKFYPQQKNTIKKQACKLCKQNVSSFVNSLTYGLICMNCYYSRK